MRDIAGVLGDGSPSVCSGVAESHPDQPRKGSPPPLREESPTPDRAPPPPPPLIFSACSWQQGTSSPQTPTFARKPWTPQTSAVASPQGSVYYTASETGSPLPNKGSCA